MAIPIPVIIGLGLTTVLVVRAHKRKRKREACYAAKYAQTMASLQAAGIPSDQAHAIADAHAKAACAKAPRARRSVKTTSADLPPGIAKPLEPSGSGPEGLQWSRFYIGEREAREVYIGDLPPGDWAVTLRVVQPGIEGAIRFRAKSGKKNYGWNDPPPGGEGVAKGIIGLVNGGLEALAPAGEVVATAYGVTPGVVTGVVNIVTGILGAIPSAIERGRVKDWSEWREGEMGSPSERQRMKDEVARWRDSNGLHAIQGADRIGIWHWEGSSGDLPLTGLPVGGKPIPIKPGYAMTDAPSVSLEPKAGTDWQKLVLRMPATEAVPYGERRYVAVARPL